MQRRVNRLFNYLCKSLKLTLREAQIYVAIRIISIMLCKAVEKRHALERHRKIITQAAIYISRKTLGCLDICVIMMLSYLKAPTTFGCSIENVKSEIFI